MIKVKEHASLKKNTAFNIQEIILIPKSKTASKVCSGNCVQIQSLLGREVEEHQAGKSVFSQSAAGTVPFARIVAGHRWAMVVIDDNPSAAPADVP